MEVVVLRYGHRPVRDERVTTHCCLVARAFGARKIIIAGTQDNEIKKSVDKISQKWGSGFETTFTESWCKTIQEYKKKGFIVVHLTMYGIELKKHSKKLKKQKKVLAVIGSQKVEKEVYESSDYNISITNQPHSEIAALAVFLNEIIKRDKVKFSRPQIEIKPSKKGKQIIKAI